MNTSLRCSPITGIDSDKGSEFINEHLLAYCHAHRITFTHSRPANKDDAAHVQEKNWARSGNLSVTFATTPPQDRTTTTRERNREDQRLEKVLEDACVKLSAAGHPHPGSVRPRDEAGPDWR